MDSQRSWALRLLALLGGFAVLAALLTPGCGVSSASSDSVRVWGRVTYRGKPVSGGAIVFMPFENLHTNWGIGQIEKSGKYSLSTFVPNTTLPPGPYRIFLRPKAPTIAEVNRNPKRRDEAERDKSPKVPDKAESTIPERFLKPETSGITVNVQQASNRIDIDLKD